jgi:hypothetical protein
MFDAKKERQIFEEARKEFKGDQGSSSKNNQKSKNMACLRHLINLHHQQKGKR